MTIDIILKCILLLMREEEVRDGDGERSTALVTTIIEQINNHTKKLYGGESEIIDNLKLLISDMISHPENHNKETIIQRLYLIAKDNTNIHKVIEKSFEPEISIPAAKRSIIGLRKILNNYYRDQELIKLVSKASYQLNTNSYDGSFDEFIDNLKTNLDALSISVPKSKDTGIVGEIDISDEDNVSRVVESVRSQKDGGTRLKTGWKELNEMLQSGFRRGEMCIINALQHKYKSGFTQSLFMQLAMYNVPVMDDPNKKPLILYISFEDNEDGIMEFMYNYLYYNEHKIMPDTTTLSSVDVAKYVKERLTVTGYNVKFLRVDPGEWTYRSVFNKILEYEADGYEIHACLIDYIAKLPTTGAINTGPGGTDVRDMFNRFRNFFSSKKILLITPHQISTEGKQLLRNGVSDVSFVKEIAGKGYTELSKQLDQIVDLELYLHIAKIERKPFLTVQRGKHRIPTILDDDKMYFTLPFPYKAPILETIHNTPTNNTSGADGLESLLDNDAENDLEAMLAS